MTIISTTEWDRRNCELLPSGEIVVREAIAGVQTPSLATFTFYGGVTVKNPRTGQIWHYTLAKVASTMCVAVFDENWDTIQTIQVGNVPSGIDRYGFCVSQCGDKVLCTSPYFTSLCGPIGSGLVQTQTVASINAINTTAVDPPRGISVGWAGRVVVADGQAIWFSDPLAPETFVPQNALSFPGGQVFGLHVSAGGALVVCSEEGVFALSEQAAATGQIVIGIFQKLSDHPTTQFDTTCIAQGHVFGLGQKGIVSIDSQTGPTIFLNEDIQSHTLIPRIDAGDWRVARLYGTEHGALATFQGRIFIFNSADTFKTWWVDYDTSSGDAQRFKLRGLLTEADGEEFYLTEAGPLWKTGERDDLFSATAKTYGTVAGRMPAPPSASPVLRQAYILSDTRNPVEMTVLGVTKTGAAPAQKKPVIGTDSWDAASLVYVEPAMGLSRITWSVRSREQAPEIRVLGYPSRIPDTFEADFFGPGPRRPT